MARAAPATIACGMVFACLAAEAADSDTDITFYGGTLSLDARYRVENVEQDNDLKSATASTLRTRAGFETNPELNFGGMLEVEDIRSIGAQHYNSTTNEHTDYSVVPDPEGTEINQAYLSARNSLWRARVGRQRFVLDNARFFGDVGFRQNQQTYDAATLQAVLPEGSRIVYGYFWGVRRFVGDDHPLGDLDLRAHALNFSHGFLNGDRITAYGYLVEIEDAPMRTFSSQILGASYDGRIDISASQVLYRAEYALQSDYGNNPQSGDAWYGNAQLGMRFANQWVVNAGVEVMSGDGAFAFQTPLATLNRFNGLADIFAERTPADGLEDRYVSAYAPIAGVRIDLSWHDFRADNNARRYGTEFDADINWRITPNWLLGARLADYRAGTLAVDTRKVIGWVEVNF